MKAESTKRKLPRSRTNWKRLRRMPDRAIDYRDIPETDRNFWIGAQVVMPTAKTLLSLRLDEDVVEWFKRQGAGYQTRMNAVLRSYVRVHSEPDSASRRSVQRRAGKTAQSASR